MTTDCYNFWRRPSRPRSKPLVIAHRGASIDLQDNTIAAFRAAITAGADAFETDIVLTRDLVSLCYHDLAFPGADGHPYPVRDMDRETATELLPSAPTLQEACHVPLPIFLDIKENSLSDILAVLDLPDIEMMAHRFLVGVHSIATFEAIADRHPLISQVALMTEMNAIAAFVDRFPGHWVRLRGHMATPEAISMLRNARMQVMVTCGGGERVVGEVYPAEITYLVAIGADALIVNDPALARRVFSSSCATPVSIGGE